ncbi:MAG: DsbA family protein [Alphaproteobacteria bacterium]|nr:DsbA family protein [Alphaproteobacteria bacterium]
MAEKEIIYVGDPMCSWCWGFSPVLHRIRADYDAVAPMRVVVGGLHAFDSDPMSEDYKATIRSHWEHVAEATGQPFNYAFFDRQGFVLDTEPACRATVAVRNIKPASVWSFYESIHKGYYVEDTDTTSVETFMAYAEREGMDGLEFKAAFDSDAIRQETLEDFAWCKQAGVTGFPTVVLREDHHLGALTVGYRQFDDLKPILDAWTSGGFSLAEQAAESSTSTH